MVKKVKDEVMGKWVNENNSMDKRMMEMIFIENE
jgi:hypothetical protein